MESPYNLRPRRGLAGSCASLALAWLSVGAVGWAAEVNLYSHRHYEEDEAIYRLFTERTGIEVNVVKAEADQLMERLKAEGENSPADLLLTVDAGRLHRASEEGLLRPVRSEVLLAQVPEAYRHPEGEWYGLTLRARVLIYAKGRAKPEEVASYAALARPEWRARVLCRSSSNIYNQSMLASIIAAEGAEAAEVWVRAVRGNMARAPQGSDRDQIRAVAAGLGDVAIVNTYYLGLLEQSEDPKDREVASKVAVSFPDQSGRGTHINLSGAGVVKHAKNEAEAIALIEFLTSPEIQRRYSAVTFEYPLDLDVTGSPILEAWGEFKADPLPLRRLGELNAEATRIFDRAGWE
jgi:iron(III) transport system substrate-binding protein